MLATRMRSIQPAVASSGYDEYTVLMLHMDGSDNGTIFTDSSASGHTINVDGAVTKTAIKKFGTASGWFSDTTDDRIYIAETSDFAFGTGDFTIDSWVYTTTTNSGYWLDNRLGNDVNLLARFDSGQIDIYWGSSYHINNISISQNTWHHLALVRYSGTGYFYVDGILKDSATMVDNFGNMAMTIGARYDGTTYGLHGYIDEFRISKGIARWTSNFTPPTSAYS